ncbi:MAG: hypothetical protein LBD22_03555 [Spirochaetaceae bacterium]|nr:hypothetical protein [Spirochaetaceae bacterium]
MVKALRLILSVIIFNAAFAGYAQESFEAEDDELQHEAAPEEHDRVEPPPPSVPEADLWAGQRRRRMFELGLFHFSLGFSTPYMPAKDVVKEVWNYLFHDENINVAFSQINQDISTNFNFNFTPITIKKNTKTKTELDFWTGIESKFLFKASDETIDAVKELISKQNDPTTMNIDKMNGTITIGGYAFFELGMGAARTFVDKRLWMRAAVQVYTPLVYIKKETLSLHGYSSATSGNGLMGIEGTGEINMYLPFNMETMNVAQTPCSSGLDLSLNGRYAAFSWLDLGVDLLHIPMIPATLGYRTHAELDVNVKVPDLTDTAYWTPDKIAQLATKNLAMNFAWEFDISERVNQYCLRPLRFDITAFFKPFKSSIFIIRPMTGFSFNTAFGAFILNYGIALNLNLPVIFSFDIGTRCYEETWKHYINVIFDFYDFELDIGISLEGPYFIESWSGRGAGMYFALKIGY